MKAIRFHKTGGPEVLIYEDVPTPEPQISQPVLPFSAGGSFEDSIGGRGTYTLTWSRDAGTNAGLCEVVLASAGLKIDATFPISFRLLEYSGDLKYTPGENTITGRVKLQDSEDATNFLFNADGCDAE